ncbi:MAG: AAA domain-containing protein [Rhodospirillales bacterium]|nr:AAA domain-containing protein [Rhodospirillales bacterium]
MADVLCAVDTKRSMEPVAVKLFRDGIVGPSFVLEAFSRECRSLAELNNHPSIIPLIDFGTDQDSERKYIALAWAPENLVDYVKAHPLLGWDDFYNRFGRATLNALAFAYSRNIIHRDVKPQNVLLDSECHVRVADFGISKFRKYYRPGVTLAHFKSIPYAPEFDSEEFADSRDVYSYAVLALECLSPKQFTDYGDVYQFLEDEADLPEDVYNILKKALEQQPTDRFANVSDLLHEIETAQRERQRATANRLPCPVLITNNALDTWMSEIGVRSEQKAKDRLINELNEQCGIDRWQHAGKDTDHYVFITSEFRFQVDIAREGEDKLMILNVVRGQPSRMERLRESAWVANFEYRYGAQGVDSEGPAAMRWLQDGFDEFLVERKKLEVQRQEEKLFERWGALLRLKSEMEQLRETPIEYDGAGVNGHRIYLTVVRGISLAPELMNQPRMIKHNDGRTFTGVIENVDKNIITLYCDVHYAQEIIPARGRLVYDTRRAQVSIKRQFYSLDAVKYDRASRADLRHLLVGIQEPRVPTNIAGLDYFQADLDEDKQKAVLAALGTHDFLVVEGPPGTGKTKFITELILQYARRNPGARILLSSQTHNALDNALHKVRVLAKEKNIPLRLARIGRRGEEKIAADVTDLILENSVEAWLQSAEKSSELFLETWAVKNGIKLDMVRTAMALANLRLASGRLREAEADMIRLSSFRDELEIAKQDLETRPERGDELREAQEKLNVCLRDLSISEAELKDKTEKRKKAFENAQKFQDLKDDLATLDEADMESLEQDFLEHAEGGAKCRQLIDIVEEWRERFGRSSDFNGAYLSGCDLVAGTCLGIAGMALQSIEFDLCIVDEASKATPTEMLVPISKSKRWVVVGDPKQLPPYVGDVMEDTKLLVDFGISRDAVKETLLDHLLQKLPDFAKTSLLTQHRMIRPIGELVSHCFYDGALRNVNDSVDPWITKLVMPKPVTWFTTSKMSNRQEHDYRSGQRREFKNYAELKVTENFLKRLQFAAEQGNKTYEVILLSGYVAQVGELENLALRLARNIPRLRVLPGTVDSFQGREADVVIYSVTRSNDEGKIGFLKEWQRLNVALSRAKIGLAIIGDSLFCESIKGQNPFSEVLSYIRRHPEDCKIEEALT